MPDMCLITNDISNLVNITQAKYSPFSQLLDVLQGQKTRREPHLRPFEIVNAMAVVRIPLLCLCLLAAVANAASGRVLMVLLPGAKSHLFNAKKIGSEMAARELKVAVSSRELYKRLLRSGMARLDTRPPVVFY